MRSVSFRAGLVLSVAVAGSLLLTPATAAKPKKPPPPSSEPPPSTSTTYVRDYASVVDGVKCDLTPESVVATPDGGSVALALSSRPSDAASESCAGVSWVVSLDQFGNPQWQELVGCFGLAPGWYSFAVSLARTADGGYALGGGTLGCGPPALCPEQCGLVQKLDASGRLLWARVYSSGATDRESSIVQVAATRDGGVVAVGSFRDAASNLGAWIVKLDGAGNVQWQRKVGPAGGTHALLNAVRQTADGGYVAVGELAPPTACQYGHGCGQGVLVLRLAANGDVVWQRGFNRFDASGAPAASEHALAVVATSDGGSLVAGTWGSTTGPGTCCRGALLLKLDAGGRSEWQTALSGGVHCFFNGFNTTCHAIGAVVYSAHQTADGGYLLAGSANLRMNDGAPLVPWLARTDANGTLLWQRVYTQAHPSTGRPLSQYFASADLTAAGGFTALGFTTNPTDLSGALLAVKTDAAGLVGGCSQVRPATPLSPLDPGLAEIAPGLPVQGGTAPQGAAAAGTRPTSVSRTAGQC